MGAGRRTTWTLRGALATGLAAGIFACRGEEMRAPAEVPDLTVATSTPRIRRLTARELTNVVADLFGEDLGPRDLLPETSETGYDNGPARATVQADQAERLEAWAVTVARAAVVRHLGVVQGGCDVSTAGEDTCRRAFVDGFATRAFRRSPTTSEAQRLGAVITEGAREGGFVAGLEAGVLTVLQSPAFLYREELGEPLEGGRGRVRLLPHEVASALSFFLTGSLPDEALAVAAREGRLATGEGRRREATRLLGMPRARVQLAHFLDAWLATARLDTTAKDAAEYPTFNATLRRGMRGELDTLYGDVATSGSLTSLFTSTRAHLSDGLAGHYGVPGEGDVELDGALRAGVLTRAGFLTAVSGYDDSSPISRGVFVRAAILCAPPTPPPAGIPRDVPVPAAGTTRDRFAAHTKSPFCQSCHEAIDGVGFGFEEFDAVGAHRTTERGGVVDTRGQLLESDGADGPFVGVVDLERHLLASPRLTTCFQRQLFRFAMGAAESERDEPTFKALGAHFTVETPLVELVLAFVESRAFVEREAVAP